MEQKLIADYNSMKTTLLELRTLLKIDTLSTEKHQISIFESYRRRKEIVNSQNFQYVLSAYMTGDLSSSLIFNLEDIMYDIYMLLDEKEKVIKNYFLSGSYEYAISEEKLYDRNLITIAKLEELVKKHNHIHEINALKVFNEYRRNYDLYSVNYYDEYKFLMENYIQKFQECSERKNIFSDTFLEGLLNIVTNYAIFTTDKLPVLKKTFNLFNVPLKINIYKKTYAFILINRVKTYLKENYKEIHFSDIKWENEFIKLLGMDEEEIRKYKNKSKEGQGAKQEKFKKEINDYLFKKR